MVALVMTGGGGLTTVRVSVALPVPPALVALRVTWYMPAIVGLPVIFPVSVFIAKPPGNPVAL